MTDFNIIRQFSFPTIIRFSVSVETIKIVEEMQNKDEEHKREIKLAE